jgi:hypothetical protein
MMQFECSRAILGRYPSCFPVVSYSAGGYEARSEQILPSRHQHRRAMPNHAGSEGALGA